MFIINRRSTKARPATSVERGQVEASFIRSRYPSATDKTAYARSLGYQGRASVLVQDGLVVSHCYQDWFSFCESIQARRQKEAHHAFAA